MKWQKKLEEVARKVDAKVEAAWPTQYKLDVDEFAVKNAGALKNEGLATRLHKLLTGKYPWRQWFVLVHNFTNNNDKDRFYDICDGFIKVNVAKKVVIVNQLPNENKNPSINLSMFWNAIPNTNPEPWRPYAVIAKRLFEMTGSSCRFYLFKGVIEHKADVQTVFPAKRAYLRYVRVFRTLHLFSKKYVLIVFA